MAADSRRRSASNEPCCSATSGIARGHFRSPRFACASRGRPTKQRFARLSAGLADQVLLVDCPEVLDRRLQPGCHGLVRAGELGEQPTRGIGARAARPSAGQVLRVPRRHVERDPGVDRAAAAQDQVHVPAPGRPLSGRSRTGRRGWHAPILGPSRAITCTSACLAISFLHWSASGSAASDPPALPGQWCSATARTAVGRAIHGQSRGTVATGRTAQDGRPGSPADPCTVVGTREAPIDFRQSPGGRPLLVLGSTDILLIEGSRT